MEFSADEFLPNGELVAHVASRAVREGAIPSGWRGLTYYRFERPVPSHWDDVASLSLCIVVQGRKRVRLCGIDYFYDPFHYLVMTHSLRFEAEILVASAARPFLSLVLQVEPSIVNEVMAEMHEQNTMLLRQPLSARPAVYVSPLEQNLVEATLRFMRALDTEMDHRILAPLYLREIVYRLLQAEQCQRLAEAAMWEADANRVTAAIRTMRTDMSKSLTIADLANSLAMSQSAFAHLFKSATGVPPYQFMKQLRLDRARTLLVHGRSVNEVVTAVGYSSVSHFVHEFKRHYGETPGTYAKRYGRRTDRTA